MSRRRGSFSMEINTLYLITIGSTRVNVEYTDIQLLKSYTYHMYTYIHTHTHTITHTYIYICIWKKFVLKISRNSKVDALEFI